MNTSLPFRRFRAAHCAIARCATGSIELLLLAAGLVAVFTTLAIVAILLIESSAFFEHVSLKEFLTDTMWTPLFADAHYGILPLVAGTLTTTMVALLVAVPLGTTLQST